MDFQALFEAAPNCYLVLTPELRIVGATDAYLRATRTERGAIVGRGLFDVFPDNPDDPSADGVANLSRSLQHVIEHGEPHRMEVQKYDIRRPESEGGGFEERFWSPVNYPVLGPDGRVSFIIHHVEDVTEMTRLQRLDDQNQRTIADLSVRSEQRFSQLLDTAPDAMVVVDSQGRITLVNRQTERVFGYTRAELIGQDLSLLIPERFRAGHAAHVERFLLRPTPRPMGSGLELFGRCKDGREVPIEVSLSPLRTERGMTVSASIRDITARRRAEAAARLSAERLASAVESMQDAFALFDADDRLVLCNSVYRSLLGDGAPGPFVGRSYGEVLDALLAAVAVPERSDLERLRSERLARRREPTAVTDLKTRDGRSLRVIDRRTAEGGVVETIWDLTDDQRRSEELREARVAAEAASAAKSEFLSSMSHELRTPLNAILGFAQLSLRDKREPLSERHVERIAHVLKGGQHLLRLIDDILDLSRIEAGRLSMSIEPVDASQVLREVTDSLEPAAARAGVRLDLQAASDLPLIHADRTRFAQIAMNLGSNAIKYNRPGGRATFELALRDPRFVRVRVTDDGVGIPADKQAKVFQPFQRAGQETGPIEGTGIGLAITKRLAELMGGGVGFRSAPGEGSEFWVDLPVYASTPVALADARSARPLPARDRPRSGSVLYVEDNPANVRFMEDLMRNFEGVELIVAGTAEAGVELAQRRRPTVILLDINLPGMSGFDALRALKSLPETAAIPVIALTAAASERDRLRGEEAGFYRYITKPVEVEALEGALDAVLSD